MRQVQSGSPNWPLILVPSFKGKEFFMQAGAPGGDGSQKNPYATLAAIIGTTTATSRLRAGEQNVINILPRVHNDDDNYSWQGIDEAVVIPRYAAGLRINGCGPRGSVGIDPSTEDAIGMDVRADDVELHNVGVAAEDDTAGNFALKVYGSRFRAYDSKFEGGAAQVFLGPGTIAQEAAGTHGVGADALFQDCEFCWGTNGIVFTSSDYGACTQPRLIRPYFHNLTGDCLDENDAGAIGAFRNLLVQDPIFGNAEDNTAPTKYCDLDSAGSTGLITNPIFATTLFASSLIGIAAGVHIIGWKTEREIEATDGGTNGRPD